MRLENGRRPQFFVSGHPYTDYTDVPQPIDGDLFLYTASADLFYYSGSWEYVGAIGSSAYAAA